MSRRFLFVIGALAITGTLFAVRNEIARDPAVSATTSVPGESHGDSANDGRRQQLIGVRTTRVTRRSIGDTIRTVGTVQYDESRLADINLKLDGWVQNLQVTHVGQTVARGQALFTLSSTELLSAQTDLVGALKNRDQVLKAADGAEYNARMVDAPRQRLVQWDVPEDELRSIEQTLQVRPVVFRSPVAGVVIEKNVLNGMHVDAGQTLYRIADLSVVWIDAVFRELDLSELRVGAGATVTTDAWPGEKRSGRIVHVYPYMTEPARTVRARIALENPGGRLKPGMFTNVDVDVSPRDGLWVPADAIVDSGARQTVFVAMGNGRFEPRSVAVGARASGHGLILDGLQEGDEVVERATFFIDSESQLHAALESYQAPAGVQGSSSSSQFRVGIRVTTDPPKSGKNDVEVQVRDASGRPVTDADVRLLFSMPAMPSMNMPAMRSEATLGHIEGGLYRGPATIPMAGRWDVTATASRRGERIADQRASLVVH